MAKRVEETAHLDEGQIRAFLDGELTDGEAESVRAHLEACTACRQEAEAQTRAADVTAEALGFLDPAPDLEATRARILARRGRGSGDVLPLPSGASRGGRYSLPRAASIALLLTGATASALPGSPVRHWIEQGWDALRGGEAMEAGATDISPDDAANGSTSSRAVETGITLPAGEAGVELWIQGLPPGAQVRIQWVDRGQAGIFAGEGTLYRRQDNRLEAQAPPGSVRVEIPRNLIRAVVGVNGSVVLRLTEEGVELNRPVESSSETEILFSPFESRGGRP